MTALDFPIGPSDKQIYGSYIYDATRSVWNINAQVDPSKFIMSGTKPSPASPGEVWFDTSDGSIYLYYDDGSSAQWIEAGSQGLSYNTVENLSDTTLTSPANGQVLQYNGTTWVDGITLNPSSPVIGQVLVYNGSEWINGESAGGFETTFLLMGA
jgi:hypothetical protein